MSTLKCPKCGNQGNIIALATYPAQYQFECSCRYKLSYFNRKKPFALITQEELNNTNFSIIPDIQFTFCTIEDAPCLKNSWAIVWFNGVWHTFDKEGVGGENDRAQTVEGALKEAYLAAKRQNFI